MFLKVVALLLAVFLTVGRTGIMGGPLEVDENREDVQDALKFAVNQHNKASNDMFISQVSRVIKAQTQIVSGTNYIFKVEMVRTNCKKGGVENECATHSDPETAKPHECDLNVWSQPWTGTIKLTKNTC